MCQRPPIILCQPFTSRTCSCFASTHEPALVVLLPALGIPQNVVCCLDLGELLRNPPLGGFIGVGLRKRLELPSAPDFTS